MDITFDRSRLAELLWAAHSPSRPTARQEICPTLTHHGLRRRGGYRFFVEREDLRRGTFAPFFRASLNPIAMACFRLLTLLPEPLLSVPFFRRCIADLTVFDADLPYFAMCLHFGR